MDKTSYTIGSLELANQIVNYLTTNLELATVIGSDSELRAELATDICELLEKYEVK